MKQHTDRKMLELVAKTAGVKIARYQDPCEYYKEWGIFPVGACDHTEFWNPLTDDGDALRLAVKLLLRVEHTDHAVHVGPSGEDDTASESVNSTTLPRERATRRAIVRAAAEIGKGIYDHNISTLFVCTGRVGRTGCKALRWGDTVRGGARIVGR